MVKNSKKQGSFPSLTKSVSFHFIDVKPFLRDREKLRKWIFIVCNKHGVNLGQVSFNFCSDKYLLKMNRAYLKHDYYTDIITFDLGDRKTISGDIYISIDRVRDNAMNLDNFIKDELHRVMIHGILHLLGFKDKSQKDAKLMRIQENESLSLLP
jgi:rRNA maturation RNase YbeY